MDLARTRRTGAGAGPGPVPKVGDGDGHARSTAGGLARESVADEAIETHVMVGSPDGEFAMQIG